MKVIFLVMNTTQTVTVVKIRPEENKFRPVWDLSPWPL